MTYIGETKEGTKLYRRVSILGNVSFQTEVTHGKCTTWTVGLSWSKIEEIIKREKLVEPLKEIPE